MIGTTMGHFHILDLLGKGGMGEVERLDREGAPTETDLTPRNCK